MKIGFIGLGNMGAPMAHNLAKAGYEVAGFDLSSVDVDGVKIVNSLKEVCDKSGIVITMLPNGAALKTVYDEIVPMVSEGSLLIDCSTVDIESSQYGHTLAGQASCLSIDAPVSGGIVGASEGTLTFMVGGSDTAFEKALPLLDVMGGKQVHCGSGGTGQAAKICNNMILGVTMISVCEAFALGDKLNLSREKLFDVVSTSSGSCWAMNTYCPAEGIGPKSPSDNNYEPGFAADLMLKDLKLSQQAADSVSLTTDAGALAKDRYQRFVDEGKGAKDFSAILESILK